MNYLYAYEAVAGNKYSISSSESTVASIASVLMGLRSCGCKYN